MPVIPNAQAQEIPWRPGYRNFVLAGRDRGLGCIAGYSVIEPGAGVPLHAHKDVDEIFILLEGALDLRLGPRAAPGRGQSHDRHSRGRAPRLRRGGRVAGADVHLHAAKPRHSRRHHLFRGRSACGRGAALGRDRAGLKLSRHFQGRLRVALARPPEARGASLRSWL